MDDLLPLSDEEEEILPSNQALRPELLDIPIRSDEMPLLPAALPEVVRDVCEPTRQLLVGIIGETHEATMCEVLQETTTEEWRAAVPDAEEPLSLDLVPVVRDDNMSMVDRDAAVDDVEALQRLLDRGLDESRIVDKLNLDEVADLLREAGEALSSSLRDDVLRVLDAVEEDVDITRRNVLIPLGGGSEVLIRGLIEHQLPGIPTAEPASLIECLIDEWNTIHEVGELGPCAGTESLLDRDGVESHGYFRPRRTVRMRPKIARTKVKSQNLRMIASLHYQYTTASGPLHVYLGT